MKAAGPGLWRVTLRAGESVELAVPGATDADRTVAPVARPVGPNPFGVH